MGMPLVVQNNEVMFNIAHGKPNGVRTFDALHNWMTPYGLLIPMHYDCNTLRYALMHGTYDADIKSMEGTYTRAGLITNKKELKILEVRGVDGKLHVFVESIPLNESTKFVRCENTKPDEVVTALFARNRTNVEILDFLRKHSRINTRNVIIAPIPELCQLAEKSYDFGVTVLIDTIPKRWR